MENSRIVASPWFADRKGSFSDETYCRTGGILRLPWKIGCKK
jgi:hypothetical protein